MAVTMSVWFSKRMQESELKGAKENRRVWLEILGNHLPRQQGLKHNNCFFIYSIPQFSHLARLLLVHGRKSYKRSASLSQFVIHRGLIISTMQAVFSSVFYLSSVALYQGFLMVGYATVYTMFPVSFLLLAPMLVGLLTEGVSGVQLGFRPGR